MTSKVVCSCGFEKDFDNLTDAVLEMHIHNAGHPQAIVITT